MLTRTTQAYDRSGGVPDLICSLYHLLHYTHEDGTPFELSLRSRLHMIMDIACALQHLSSKAFLHLGLVEGRHGGHHPSWQVAQGHLQERIITEIVLPVITAEQHPLGDWLGQSKS